MINKDDTRLIRFESRIRRHVKESLVAAESNSQWAHSSWQSS